MKPIFLGICALVTPFFYDRFIKKGKSIKKIALQNVKRKFQLVDQEADISKISEDYPIIVYKPLKISEILDHEIGLRFSDVVFIKRTIEVVDKDTLTEASIQPTKYRSLTDKELSERTNGKFENSRFDLFSKHISLRGIKLDENFFKKNLGLICQEVLNSKRLIANPLNSSNEIILQNPNDPKNKFLDDKFLDFYTTGNNVYIQANKRKLLKNDLKINYKAHQPISFILIGSKEKSTKLKEHNNEIKTNNITCELKSNDEKNEQEKETINCEKKEINLVLKPATKWWAKDYIIIPFEASDKTKIKEEIEICLENEIQKLDYFPWEKKACKYIIKGGFILIGYGIILNRIRNSVFWDLKEFAIKIIRFFLKRAI